MQTRSAWSGLLRVLLACLALIALFIAVDLLFFANGASFKREWGGLETVTAVLYFVAVAVFLRMVPRVEWRRLFHVPVLLFLFALRELDWDKAFTGSGILSTKLYSSPDTPLSTKLIGGAVALFAIYVILRTAWRGLHAVIDGIRSRDIWPWFGVLAAALVVGAKSVDGLERKLLTVGIQISDGLDTASALFEEVAEVFIPVCAILAIYDYGRRFSK